MNSRHPILDTSSLDLSGDFDDQVRALLAAIRLTKEEVEDIGNLLRDMGINFHGIWPGCKIMPFGSIITGLGIKTSDIDCFVSLPPWETKPPNRLVFKAYHSLSTQPTIFTGLQAIGQAKVPIVKFLHIPTNTHCDVSFKSPQGLRNSMLLSHLLHLDHRALPLAVIIKYWAKVHKLTGTNYMPNYALTLLVVFYLQQVDILPSVYELQKDMSAADHCLVDKWETGFKQIKEHVPKKENEASLYELLGGFFEFYSNYDFVMNVISLYTGDSVKRELFRNLSTVPGVFKLYTNNVQYLICGQIRINNISMCVQDPFDHSRNCAVAVTVNLFGTIIQCFKYAAQQFAEGTSTKFLSLILKESVAKMAPPVPKIPPALMQINVFQPRPVTSRIMNRFLEINAARKRRRRQKNGKRYFNSTINSTTTTAEPIESQQINVYK